jgi:hypothetical protein
VSFRVQLCLRFVQFNSNIYLQFSFYNNFSERDQLVRYIEEKFIKEITNIAQTENENSGLDPPKLVPYIPYAYQMVSITLLQIENEFILNLNLQKMSRAAVRSHPILKDFHEFLINETELVHLF